MPKKKFTKLQKLWQKTFMYKGRISNIRNLLRTLPIVYPNISKFAINESITAMNRLEKEMLKEYNKMKKK